jgi:hypothetical protein
MSEPCAQEPPGRSAWARQGAHRRRGTARRRVVLACGVVALTSVHCFLTVRPAHGVASKTESGAVHFNPAELTAQLDAIADTQRNLAGTLAELRDQLAEVQRTLGEVREEARQDREAFQAEVEQTKGMREEVRGLYVESSGLKGDIAQLVPRLEGFEESLGSFRLSSGIVVAVVIVLQVVLLGLAFRGHS